MKRNNLRKRTRAQQLHLKCHWTFKHITDHQVKTKKRLIVDVERWPLLTLFVIFMWPWKSFEFIESLNRSQQKSLRSFKWLDLKIKKYYRITDWSWTLLLINIENCQLFPVNSEKLIAISEEKWNKNDKITIKKISFQQVELIWKSEPITRS